MRNPTKQLVFTVIALVLLGPHLTASPDKPSARHFLIAAGFLCDLAPGVCPFKVSASSGDVIELSGTGSFVNPRAAQITGEGSYVLRDSAGNLLDSGIWRAVRLLSFKSYGTTPGTTPPFEGGLAVMRVQLLSDLGGPPRDATLTTNCSEGSPPPGFTSEFENLDVSGGENFDTFIQGFNVFIPLP